jgi:hypothetical protein
VPGQCLADRRPKYRQLDTPVEEIDVPENVKRLTLNAAGVYCI